MTEWDKPRLEVLLNAIRLRGQEYYGIGLPSEWKLMQNYEAGALVELAMRGLKDDERSDSAGLKGEGLGFKVGSPVVDLGSEGARQLAVDRGTVLE